MNALRPLVTVVALLLAVTGLASLGTPAQAAGLPAVRSFTVASQVDHAAKVVWTAPATTRAVKRYRIAWGDRAVVVAPSVRSYVVPGLANGVATAVRIRPVYGPGLAGERRTVQAMGAARPGTPGAPTLTGAGTAGGASTAVTVAWAPVAANGPAPVQYRVHRTSAAGSTVVCDWTAATSCVNTVPNDGSLHTYRVRARNAEATSARAAGHRLDYISPLGAGSSLVAEAPVPTPTISAAKGAPCGPGVGTTCAGAVACSSTCWYITATAANFAASATCRAFLADGTPFGGTWTQVNGTHSTSSWVGPGTTFYLACGNGARSGTYTF